MQDSDAPDELRSLLQAVRDEQPLPASGTELILIEVDPHRAHAYWNIDASQADSSKPLVLRVHDITDQAKGGEAQSFDVEVQGLQGRWYLDFWRDDRTFVSELGYRQPDGTLSLLARSNEVRTPVAEPVEASGGHVDHNGDPLFTDWPGDNAAAPVSQTDETVPDVSVVAPVPQDDATVAEPVTILEPDFPLTSWNDEEDEDAVDAPASSKSSSPAAVAAGDAAVAFDEEVMSGPEQEQESAAAAAATGFDAFPSAEELAFAIEENHEALRAFYAAAAPEFHESFMPPEPERREVQLSDAPPAPSVPAPLEQIVGLSSMENAHKDVLLEVNAELHIYGRARPDTELTLYGQVVRTRPDGTFSVRRPLPHGAVVLPLLYTRPEH